jgi:hypothetical protein
MKHQKYHHPKYHYHYGLIHHIELIFVEVFIAVLVFVSLGILAIEFFLDPNDIQLSYLRNVDIVIAGILIGEFFIRFMLSRHRAHYLRHNWWYIFAGLPLPIALAPGLRSIRLIGFIRSMTVGIHVLFEKHLYDELSEEEKAQLES